MKVLAFILALCAYASHARTYTLESVDDFKNFAEKVKLGTSYEGDTVVLESDLDLCDLSPDYEPIGDEENKFKGTFDGQGHVIYNLRFYDSDSLYTMYAGMFGYSKEATFTDLVFDASCFMQSQYKGSDVGMVGMLSGYCEKCTIDSVVNMGDVEYAGRHSFEGNEAAIGGIIGQGHKELALTNSMSFGTVTFSGSRYCVDLGGLVGNTKKSDCVVANSANYGDITYDGYSDDIITVGGIIGYAKEGYKASRVVNMGRISVDAPSFVTDYVGNIVGYSKNGAIEYAFWADNTGYSKVIGTGSTGTSTSTTSEFDYEFKRKSGAVIIDSLNFNNNQYMRWTIRKMHLDGGSLGAFANKYYTGSAISLPVFVKQLPTPGKEGYLFDGWFTDKACTKPYNNNAAVDTVYASWESANSTCEFSGASEKKAFGFLTLVVIAIALLF